MVDDGSMQTGSVWPLPKFHFAVRFGDANPVAFSEVSGLEVETQAIEHRHGSAGPIKVPALARLRKSGNVTLKKGIFAKDNAFWSWFKQIQMNTIKRETVTISLLDESGAATMVWTLTNAFPTKVSGSDLKSEGDEVAVETIELAFEEMKVVKPD